MTHAQKTLKISAVLFAISLWAQLGNAQTSTPAPASAPAADSAPAAGSELIEATTQAAGAVAAQLILDSLNEADRARPESAPEDIEARDILVGAMMSKATEATTCTMVTVVAPVARNLWERLTSNRDLSIASVSDLGGGGKMAYDPIYNEAGFAIGVFGKKPTIQLREHGATGPRVLYSGSKAVFTRKLEDKGYVVGYTPNAPCHFDWRAATAAERYEILLKARQSVKES